MDRRKIYLDKQETFYDTMNAKELNLEIAKNIELVVDLKEIIKMKAFQTYEEKKENKKIFTLSTKNSNLDDRPKLLYIVSFLVWFIMYRNKILGKLSLIWGGMTLTVILNMRKQYYCKIQKEYEDFSKLNENLKKVLYLKKKSYTFERVLDKFFNVEYKPELLDMNIIKYEYLF